MIQKQSGTNVFNDKGLSKDAIVDGNILGVVNHESKSVMIEPLNDNEGNPPQETLFIYAGEIDSIIEVLTRAKERLGGHNG